jgi:nitroimidazol reductase NimA-like FMN-containing flavoprotein (pyridoxamine 5'-phosphate oxidase superfamily)
MDRALRKKISGLLQGQKLGILATLGPSYPYQNIVAFAVARDLKSIVFATRRATSKYRNLKRRKRVAIFFDDRVNRASDFQQATGVTALGTAGEARGEGRARPARLLRRRHPFLREFLDAPDCAIFVIRVRTYIVVLHFQETIEVRVGGGGRK